MRWKSRGALKSKYKKHETRDTDERTTSLVDWRHPTVAWLADSNHFQPAVLPKLQLPRTNEGKVYETSGGQTVPWSRFDLDSWLQM